MDIKSALFWAESELKDSREGRSSALVLISDVLGMGKSEVFAHPQKKLTLIQKKKFKKYISRRKNHEPVWQIIGKVRFWDLDFLVTKDVLVPRPETEFLVKKAIKEIKSFSLEASRAKHQRGGLDKNQKSKNKNFKIKILEVGTGSGAIIVSLASELIKCFKSQESSSKSRKDKKNLEYNYEFVATDISKKALRVAQKNAKNIGVEEHISFINADLFPPEPPGNRESNLYDFIFTNLPYIPSKDIKSLDPDVRLHEPLMALDGGGDGLNIYRRFFSQVGKYIKKRGVIICEIGSDQGNAIKKIVLGSLLGSKCVITKDLANHDRIAIIKLIKNDF